MEYRALWTPRRGHLAEEYEDAFAADPARGRFAVADGASESAFAACWAKFLADEFVCGDVGWSEWLPAAQARWQESLNGRKLPWYAEEKVRQGAFATFLGLSLAELSPGEEGPAYRWRATAVGDSCLFHTSSDGLVRAFPIECREAMGNSPRLVGSRTPLPEVIEHRAEHAEGTAGTDSWMWLMTDALAHWFLGEHALGRSPWNELAQFWDEPDGSGRFVRWLDGLRDAGRLRNDDVTLVAVRL
jgi:hypothetical protein